MPWERRFPSAPKRRLPPPSKVEVGVEMVMFFAGGGAIQRCPAAYAAPVAGVELDPDAPKIVQRPPPAPRGAARPVPRLNGAEIDAMRVLGRLLDAEGATGTIPVSAWRLALRADGSGFGAGCNPQSRQQVANRTVRSLAAKGAVEITGGMARPIEAKRTK